MISDARGCALSKELSQEMRKLQESAIDDDSEFSYKLDTDEKFGHLYEDELLPFPTRFSLLLLLHH